METAPSAKLSSPTGQPIAATLLQRLARDSAECSTNPLNSPADGGASATVREALRPRSIKFSLSFARSRSQLRRLLRSENASRNPSRARALGTLRATKGRPFSQGTLPRGGAKRIAPTPGRRRQPRLPTPFTNRLPAAPVSINAPDGLPQCYPKAAPKPPAGTRFERPEDRPKAAFLGCSPSRRFADFGLFGPPGPPGARNRLAEKGPYILSPENRPCQKGSRFPPPEHFGLNPLAKKGPIFTAAKTGLAEKGPYFLSLKSGPAKKGPIFTAVNSTK